MNTKPLTLILFFLLLKPILIFADDICIQFDVQFVLNNTPIEEHTLVARLNQEIIKEYKGAKSLTTIKIHPQEKKPDTGEQYMFADIAIERRPISDASQAAAISGQSKIVIADGKAVLISGMKEHGGDELLIFVLNNIIACPGTIETN